MRETEIKNRVRVEHPGVYVGEELEARRWTQRDLGFVLGRQEQVVSMIVSGKRDINATMAKALGAAFDVSADLFLNLQQEYNKSIADEPDESVSRRGRLVRNYPLRDMIKRGWIEDAEPALLEFQIAKFFEVERFDQAPYLQHPAKEARYDEIPASQLAWLFRVRRLAKGMSVARYSDKKLKRAVSQMSKILSVPEDVCRVPRLLTEAGVRFVVVECLPNDRVDAGCQWLDEKSPTIGMSTRIDRLDNFWFVLRHEIEHVLQEDSQKQAIIDTEIDPTASDLSAEESRANAAAERFCKSGERMESFNRKNSKSRIRHHIVSSTLVDGWGTTNGSSPPIA